jgi:hypothetical protein
MPCIARRLPLIAGFALAALLAGCGVTPQGASSGSGGQAPAETTRTVPNATPTPPGGAQPTGPSGQNNAITLILAQTPTTRYDPLRVIIINGYAATITAADHQSGCTVFTVEQQGSDTWTAVGPCRLMTPTRLVPIRGGDNYSQSIGPLGGAGGAWQPGTYRVVFRYSSADTGTPGGPAGVVYSDPFTIG